MPYYHIEAIELFPYRTTYVVEAETAEEAERMCREGEVTFIEKRCVDEGCVWEQTLEVKENATN